MITPKEVYNLWTDQNKLKHLGEVVAGKNQNAVWQYRKHAGCMNNPNHNTGLRLNENGSVYVNCATCHAIQRNNPINPIAAGFFLNNTSDFNQLSKDGIEFCRKMGIGEFSNGPSPNETNDLLSNIGKEKLIKLISIILEEKDQKFLEELAISLL